MSGIDPETAKWWRENAVPWDPDNPDPIRPGAKPLTFEELRERADRAFRRQLTDAQWRERARWMEAHRKRGWIMGEWDWWKLAIDGANAWEREHRRHA